MGVRQPGIENKKTGKTEKPFEVKVHSGWSNVKPRKQVKLDNKDSERKAKVMVMGYL